MESLEVIRQRQLDETEARHARWEAEDAAQVLSIVRQQIEARVSQFEQDPASDMFLYLAIGFLDGIRDSKALKYEELDAAYKRLSAVTISRLEKMLRERQERADLETPSTLQ